MSLKLSTYLNYPTEQKIKFWKFAGNPDRMALHSYGNLNMFLSKNDTDTIRRLYTAGPSLYVGYGLGLNRTTSGQSGGFEPTTLIDPDNPWEPGETIEDFYFGGYCMYYKTNLGNVYSVGYGAYGQLGLGNTSDQYGFKKITTFDKNVAQLYPSESWGSYDWCFAITKSGELYVWGYNASGIYSFGLINDNTNKLTPVRVNQGSIFDKTIIYARASSDPGAYASSIVIDSNRDVHVCGFNGSGVLGVGNVVADAATTQTTGFIQVTGVKADAAWVMHNGYGSATAFLFNKQTGKVYGSGYNGYGQLGTGNTTPLNTFTEVTFLNSLSTVEFFAGNDRCGNPIAIISDGTVRIWGNNDYSQVGDGTATARVNTAYNPNDAPSNLDLGPSNRAIKVQCGGEDYESSTILTSTGKMYVCGYNNYGQLGVGDSVARTVWTLSPHPTGKKWIDFEWRGKGSVQAMTAVDEDGDIWCTGYAANYSNAQVTQDGIDSQVWRKAHIVGGA